ncbi:exit protein of rhodopsin and TRP A [Colletes latitarsis]|uniref:exit protein of rhodopsin and TRP A n=1 Tax=Colletes latitarsis TaxID=2605962 RepID=UPI004035D67F
MKKRSNHDNRVGKSRQNETKPTEDKKNGKKEDKEETVLNDDTHNQGFSEWLRSSDGIEMMRLFVIANSILVFVTMGWPKMQEVISALRDYFSGEE